VLIRLAWRAGRPAAVLLLRCAGWTASAAALNAGIVGLNPGT
jgi:tryptophan-rich sensory protein